MFSIFLFLFVFAGHFSALADYPLHNDRPVLKEDNTPELKIYPNPVETGRITLEIKNGKIDEIRLIDIAGKEIIVRKINFGVSKYQLQLDEIPSGIYFVRIKTSKSKIIVKKLAVASH